MTRTSDPTAERDTIRAAMNRLLSGQPTRSTGALTVLQLAAEAGVKRWVLTHKYPDLRTEFEEKRESVTGIPQAFQHLQASVIEREADNKKLRTENVELTKRADTYAQVIYELTTELERYRTGTHGNLRFLPTQQDRP